jgi:hypothetical protein
MAGGAEEVGGTPGVTVENMHARAVVVAESLGGGNFDGAPANCNENEKMRDFR